MNKIKNDYEKQVFKKVGGCIIDSMDKGYNEAIVDIVEKVETMKR